MLGEVGHNMMMKNSSVPPYGSKDFFFFAFPLKRPQRYRIPPHPFKIPNHQIPMDSCFTHLVHYYPNLVFVFPRNMENRAYERLLEYQDGTLVVTTHIQQEIYPEL